MDNLGLAVLLIVGVGTFGIGPVFNALWTVANVTCAFLGAIVDFVTMNVSMIGIASDTFVEIVISMLKLMANVLKFTFVLFTGLWNILTELLPVCIFLVQCTWALIWKVLTPIIKYTIMLPYTFSVEISSFFLYVYESMNEWFVLCYRYYFDRVQYFYDGSRTVSDKILSYGTSCYNLIFFSFDDAFVYFSHVSKSPFFAKDETIPRASSHDYTFYICCAIIAIVIIAFHLRESLLTYATWVVTTVNGYFPARNNEEEEEDAQPAVENDLDDAQAEGQTDQQVEEELPDDTASLQRLLEDERDQKLCVVCQDRPKSIVLLPCRHLCLCPNCSREIMRPSQAINKECPICRREIERFITIFV